MKHSQIEELFKLYWKVNKNRVVSSVYANAYDIVNFAVKNFNTYLHYEKDKLVGFICYEISESEHGGPIIFLHETHFNSPNPFSFVKALKKISSGCETAVFQAKNDRSDMIAFYNRIGAKFLKSVNGYDKYYLEINKQKRCYHGV